MSSTCLALDEPFAARFQLIADRVGAPGASGVVIEGDQLRAVSTGLRRTGLPDPMLASHRLPLSCVIKPMVGLAVLALEKRGLVSLDAPVEKYLPELLDDSVHKITLRHLLTHTAGYVEPRDPAARWSLTWDRFAASFAGRQQAFRPGSAWSYCHSGYAILARAVEQVTGRSANDVLREHVTDPLGMALRPVADAAAEPKEFSALHVANPRVGGSFVPMRPPVDSGFLRFSLSDLTLSLVDIARFAAALSGNRHYAGSLDPALTRRLLQGTFAVPQLRSTRSFEGIPTAFRTGIGQFGRFMGVNGSYVGSTCAIRYNPRSGAALAVGMNAWLPLTRESLVDLLARRLPRSPVPLRQPSIVAHIGDLIGKYDGLMLGTGSISVVPDGEGAIVHATQPGSANRSNELVRLQVDSRGKLLITPIIQGGAIGVFKPKGARQYALMIGSSAYIRRDYT